MQRILAFVATAPFVAYLAASGLSNIDKQIHKYKTIDSREYYEIKSFEPGNKIEISVEAMSFDHAFGKGLKEMKKVIGEINKENNVNLPIQRPLYAYQPEKVLIETSQKKSSEYNFKYNLYYTLNNAEKLSENVGQNDFIKKNDGGIVAVRTCVNFLGVVQQ